MKRLACAILLLAAVASPAMADDPSFDCAKASTAVEKTICDEQNPQLALRDGALARLYDALKQETGHDAVLAGQAAWLKTRDACGGDVACLTESYDERLAVLAREAGDQAGVTGNYHYKASETDSGDAFVVRESDGTLAGKIGTVAGPSSHTCELTFAGANPIGDAWIWDDPDAGEGSEDFCRILFRPGLSSLRIDSDACQTYCGARGYFDQTYTRLK